MNELFNNIDEQVKNNILKELEVYTRIYEKNKRILSSVKNDDIICILISGHIQIVKNDAYNEPI